MPNHPTATQNDIARRLGVAQRTVSRVFAAPETVSDELRERVEQAARALGYRPHASARAMRTGLFHSVTLVQSVKTSASNLPPEQLAAIHDALQAAGFSLTLARFDDRVLTSAEDLPKALRELSADGVLVNYDLHLPSALAELIRRHRIPAAWINSEQDADCVLPDDRGLGRRAAEELLARGHRHIAYLDFVMRHHPRWHVSRRERHAGCRSAVIAAGGKVIDIHPDRALDDPAGYLAEHFTGAGRPTAAVCYSLVEAAPLLRAAWERLHLRIPEQLSVVTFGEVAPQLGIDLACCLVPVAEVGRRAVGLLLERIAAPRRHQPPLRIAGDFVAGGSLGTMSR